MTGGLSTNAIIGVVFACLSGVALVFLAAVVFIYRRRERLCSCRPPCMRRNSDTESISEISTSNSQVHITDATFVSAPPDYHEAVDSQELPPAYDNLYKNISTTPAGLLQPELSSYGSSATLNTSIAGVSIIGPPPDYSAEDPLGRYRKTHNHIHGVTLSSEQLPRLSVDDVTGDDDNDSPRAGSVSSPRIRQMQVTGCILTGHILPEQTEESSENTHGVPTSTRPINLSLVLDDQIPQIAVIECENNATEPRTVTTTRELSPSSEAGIQNEAFVYSDESDDKTDDQDSRSVIDNQVPGLTVIERDENETEITGHDCSSHTSDNATRADRSEAGIENKAFVDSDGYDDNTSEQDS